MTLSIRPFVCVPFVAAFDEIVAANKNFMAAYDRGDAEGLSKLDKRVSDDHRSNTSCPIKMCQTVSDCSDDGSYCGSDMYIAT